MSFVGKSIDRALDRTRARTPTARAVLAQLARHADKDYFSRPSQGLLARRAGISPRQVRTYLRELEKLGEIEAVEKGANRPTKFRVNILDDEILDRQHPATPEHDMDRKSTTGPENARSGGVTSVDRQCAAYEVSEGTAPRYSASENDGWHCAIAENKEGYFG